MAQNLSNATGIGTDGDYLNGNIVDNQTLINAFINQDIIQFFQKLMDDANLAPNDLDDNETNGYQFVEALQKYIIEQQKNVQTDWVRIGVDESTVIINSAIDQTNSFMYYRFNLDGDFEIWLDKVIFNSLATSNTLLDFSGLLDILNTSHAGSGIIEIAASGLFKPIMIKTSANADVLFALYENAVDFAAGDEIQAVKVIIRKGTYTTV